MPPISSPTKPAKKDSIQLSVADWADVSNVLKQSWNIWGAGLTRDKYYEWQWSQLLHPWSRKNYRFLVARNGFDVVSSCKLYLIDFQSRGRQYRVAGIGGVFTPDRFRGHGYASQMLELVGQRCEADGFDAMFLYSDIDPLFYERLGYEPLSNYDFHIWLNDPAIERFIMSDGSFAEDMHQAQPELSVVEPADIAAMIGHYRHFLARRQFGVARDEQYWKFKLNREQFRARNSEQPLPSIEIMSINLGSPDGGYALFEQGGQILRVLEVVGSESVQNLLWRHLLRTALLRRIQLVRGWEGMTPTVVRGLRYAERDWGHPMIRPMNDEVEAWFDLDQNPMLELDHF